MAPPGAAGFGGHVATPWQGAGGPLPRATREVSEMLTVPFFFFSTCPAAVFLKFSHFLAPRPWREIFAPGEPPSPCVDLTGGRMAPCRPPRFSQCLHQREYAMKEHRRPGRGGPGGRGVAPPPGRHLAKGGRRGSVSSFCVPYGTRVPGFVYLPLSPAEGPLAQRLRYIIK